LSNEKTPDGKENPASQLRMTERLRSAMAVSFLAGSVTFRFGRVPTFRGINRSELFFAVRSLSTLALRLAVSAEQYRAAPEYRGLFTAHILMAANNLWALHLYSLIAMSLGAWSAI
jgi:hypothetical protein